MAEGSGARALVVTVDTEEEGLWSSSYRMHGNTCENIARLSTIHEVFSRLGVKPTYLIDYPVATDRRACEIVSCFAEGDRSEVGAHLHPWCNPPFDPVEQRLYDKTATYTHNLPAALQTAKLRLLCEAIGAGTGVAPLSYRAGRWGFNHTSIPALEAAGIVVDTSVMPFWWDRQPGGSAFISVPFHPYVLDRADVCRPGDSGILEVPVSAMLASRWGPALEWLVGRTGPVPGLRRVLLALGFSALRPEIHSVEEMRGLADNMAARGTGVFNLMFHSSVALPGATPYATDRAGVEAFRARLERTLEYILSRHDAVPLRLCQVPAFLGTRAEGEVRT